MQGVKTAARRKSSLPTPGRSKTDDSLRTERTKSDQARKVNRASAERAADGVIHHARAVADAVLTASRLTADHPSLRPQGPAESGAIGGQRDRADRAVRGERADADLALRTDRRDQADALNALLVHERAVTDAHLLTERSQSDTAVANRDDFLGIVAHDVRNLLNGVVLSLELLQPSDGPAPAHVAAAAGRIRRYVARMNRLIGDLVDITSIDAGRLAMSPVRGDAAALVAEAVETFQPAALEKGVSLSAQLPGGALIALFDHDRLLQVFANVIANAIKFTPLGGKIGVRVEERRGLLRFCVSDTGQGIPTPSLEAIFKRFWQVGANDRRGQGLGLYIARSIVDAHGGRMWAESEPGKGTRMYFTLPLRSSLRRGGPGAASPRRLRPPYRGNGRANRQRPS